jgi:PKD repeat protein
VDGGERNLSATETSLTIDGLVNDVKYTFSVQASYDKGLSGKISQDCTPKNARFPVTNFAARAGNALVKLSWTKPANDACTGYTITVNPGGSTIEVNSSATEAYELGSLTNGTEYTFSIVAVYPQGASEALTKSATPGDISPIIVASATLTKNNPCLFEYNDIYFGEAAVQSASWNFGDGATSVELSPTHAYTTAGT